MVKLAVSVIFAAALASVALAQDAAPTVEDVNARDVAAPSAEQELFGRAAAKVMNDLFSREDLNEIFGREVEELTQRDIDELFEREIEVGDMITDMAARQEAEGAAPSDAPAAGTDAPADPKDAPADPKAQTPKAPAEKPPTHSIGGWILSWFRKAVNIKPAEKKADPKAPAPAAPKAEEPKADAPKAEGDAPAEARDVLEEPIERSLEFADAELAEREEEEALYEARELIDELDEVLEREFDEELLERELEDSELLVREFDEDMEVLERDFEDDVFERDFDEDVFERDVSEEWDDELLRRAFDLVEELEQLD